MAAAAAGVGVAATAASTAPPRPCFPINPALGAPVKRATFRKARTPLFSRKATYSGAEEYPYATMGSLRATLARFELLPKLCELQDWAGVDDQGRPVWSTAVGDHLQGLGLHRDLGPKVLLSATDQPRGIPAEGSDWPAAGQPAVPAGTKWSPFSFLRSHSKQELLALQKWFVCWKVSLAATDAEAVTVFNSLDVYVKGARQPLSTVLHFGTDAALLGCIACIRKAWVETAVAGAAGGPDGRYHSRAHATAQVSSFFKDSRQGYPFFWQEKAGVKRPLPGEDVEAVHAGKLRRKRCATMAAAVLGEGGAVTAEDVQTMTDAYAYFQAESAAADGALPDIGRGRSAASKEQVLAYARAQHHLLMWFLTDDLDKDGDAARDIQALRDRIASSDEGPAA